MNNKVLALVVVVIVIVAAAAAAIALMGADDNNTKDLDVNLEIYGNADRDSDIDEDDAVLVESWISANQSGNEDRIAEIEQTINLTFADANNNGTIDADDVEQIRAVANGTATHLWFLDGIGEDYDMDIGDAIQRIGCEYYSNTEAMLILGQNDKIVAVDNAPYVYRDFYFTEEQQRNITNMVNMNEPDYPFINSLDLDVLLIFSSSASYDVKKDHLIGTDVLYLGLYNPDLTNTASSSFIQGMLKAGYIFGAVDRAEGYTNWVLNYRDQMLDLADSIPDDEKPVCAMSNYMNQYFENGTSNTMTIYTSIDPLGQAVELAGGINILDVLDVSAPGYSFSVGIDAIFNNHPVNYFFLHNVKYTYGGSVTTAPDHGYLQDDYGPFKNAAEIALSQDFIADESITLLAGDFRNGCTGGILLAAYMGNLINPDVYSVIDPLEMHQEYIDWMGIDFDITQHGVFFYTG